MPGRALTERNASPQPLIGANLFGLSGGGFRAETHFQKKDGHFHLSGRDGNRSEVIRESRSSDLTGTDRANNYARPHSINQNRFKFPNLRTYTAAV